MDDDIPAEVLAEIEADVARYRESRLSAERRQMRLLKAKAALVSDADRVRAKRRALKDENVCRDLAERWHAGEAFSSIGMDEFSYTNGSAVRYAIWVWAKSVCQTAGIEDCYYSSTESVILRALAVERIKDGKIGKCSSQADAMVSIKVEPEVWEKAMKSGLLDNAPVAAG